MHILSHLSKTLPFLLPRSLSSFHPPFRLLSRFFFNPIHFSILVFAHFFFVSLSPSHISSRHRFPPLSFLFLLPSVTTSSFFQLLLLLFRHTLSSLTYYSISTAPLSEKHFPLPLPLSHSSPPFLSLPPPRTSQPYHPFSPSLILSVCLFRFPLSVPPLSPSQSLKHFVSSFHCRWTTPRMPLCFPLRFGEIFLSIFSI